MRIALDPVPLVIGMYAYVGELLETSVERRESESAEALGRRFGRQREGSAEGIEGRAGDYYTFGFDPA